MTLDDLLSLETSITTSEKRIYWDPKSCQFVDHWVPGGTDVTEMEMIEHVDIW